MSDPIKTCPQCGGKMRITHKRHLGGDIDERYRRCECGHRDKAYTRTTIIGFFPVACVDTRDTGKTTTTNQP